MISGPNSKNSNHEISCHNLNFANNADTIRISQLYISAKKRKVGKKIQVIFGMIARVYRPPIAGLPCTKTDATRNLFYKAFRFKKYLEDHE